MLPVQNLKAEQPI
jgi:hypothetical protein